MKVYDKFYRKICPFLLLILPAILFFSYHPVISIASNDTMNLELSLPEIWLVVFFLVNLPKIRDLWRYFGLKKMLIAGLIPLYFSLSILWSENKLRTLLTVGIFWLVVAAGLNIIFYLNKVNRAKSFRQLLMKSIILSSVAISIFCWLQCILDVAGVSREYTLLCRGCVSTAFGFPHPNGFAIEPQFMGNLLIVPVLLCYYLLSSDTYKKQIQKKAKILLILATFFLSITTFFTFSRGAIYAVVIGFIVEQILLKNRKFYQMAVIFIAAFLISLSSQGIFAAISSTDDTFISGVTKSIHHLTLGQVDWRPVQEDKKDEENKENNNSEQMSSKQNQQGKVASDFSGYVEESTNRRLDLSQVAFDTWKAKPQYIAIGAGLGSAGMAIHSFLPSEIGPKEIVQNEYVSLLLEAGIVGYIIILGVGFYALFKLKKKVTPLFISIMISFLLTLMFFSGLPNALQIYLLPVLIFAFQR